MKKFLILLSVCFMCISFVSAISVNYYYHPECGHCQKIQPFMQHAVSSYDINWNLLDTSKGSYGVDATPFIEISTDDGRKLTLRGSQDIPKYLECELAEQSNLNCQTYSASECRADSWFIR